MMTQYADLELRILKCEEQGYPVEITLNHDLHYERGYLSPDLPTQSDGARLFEGLFADDTLKTAWANARGQPPQPRRIRLRLDTDAPELHALPWEALRDPDTGLDLAGTDATPFSRYLAGTWQPGSPILERPIKILVAIVNPRDLDAYNLASLDEEAEWAALQKAVSGLKDAIELTRLPAPCTLTALEAALRQGYHGLHIIAHGAYNTRRRQAALYLADEANNVAVVKDEDVALMLKRQLADGDVEDADRLRLVFLASCQSATRDTSDAFRGLAPALVNAGVPAVVAMQDTVSITAAREFSREFYTRLLQHGVVDLAGNQARARLLTGKSPDAGVPVLFMRLKDGQLWRPVGVSENPGTGTRNTVYNVQIGQAEGLAIGDGARVIQEAPVPAPTIPSRGTATSATEPLRQQLQRLDDVQLETLCLDYFPTVYDQFSRGLRRDEKFNLLLAHCRRHPAEAKRLAEILGRTL